MSEEENIEPRAGEAPEIVKKAEAQQASDAATSEADEPQNRRARRAAAARARKQRQRERMEAEAIGLDAGEILDDAFVRSTDKAGRWAKTNSNILQWTIVSGIAIWIGFGIWKWQSSERLASSSDAVFDGLDKGFGRIEETPAPQDNGVVDPTPVFKDRASQLTAEEASLTAALERGSAADGVRSFATLALAGARLAQGKHDASLQLYNEVLATDTSKSDPELRGRAFEGVALCKEAAGDKQAALAAYESLSDAKIAGFTDNAKYQQARLALELGQGERAKELAMELKERLKLSPGNPQRGESSFLRISAQNLVDQLLPAEEPAAPAGLTREQLERLQKTINATMKKEAPAAPPPPEQPVPPKGGM